jgi:hypothetical protein
MLIYYLPSNLISIFHTSLVPAIIQFFVSYEENKLKSQFTASSMYKQMIFVIFNIILFPLLGVITLTMFIETLSKESFFIWDILMAHNITSIGEFMISYVVSMAFTSNLFDLLIVSRPLEIKIQKWSAYTSDEIR